MSLSARFPPPPWRLRGEAIVAFTGAPLAERARLPSGVRPLPGPAVVVAASYSASPVGPYRELAVCLPVLVDGRPGACVTTMVVDSEVSRRAGAEIWGFPKVVGDLRWSGGSPVRELRWAERDLRVRAGAERFAAPAWAPLRNIQHAGSGMAVTWLAVAGWLSPMRRVEVDVPRDDPLAPLAGNHPGVVVSRLRLTVGPPRLLRPYLRPRPGGR